MQILNNPKFIISPIDPGTLPCKLIQWAHDVYTLWHERLSNISCININAMLYKLHVMTGKCQSSFYTRGNLDENEGSICKTI